MNKGEISGADYGVNFRGLGAVSGIVENFGTIEGRGTSSIGLQMIYGGTVTNSGGALITGYAEGAQIFSSDVRPGEVSNSGTLQATGSAGIGMHLSTALINSGLITGGYHGVYTGQNVTNYGTIEGRAGVGVLSFGGGTISNTSTGLIRGNVGIDTLNAEAFVINNGTIVGTGFGVILRGSSLINGADGLACRLRLRNYRSCHKLWHDRR